MRGARGILILALATAVGCAVSFAAAIAQPSSGHAEIVTGTICRIDTGAGTFDLLDGVGHAFRVERIRFAPGIPVKSRRGSASVTSLVPGTVCRVKCSPGEAGPVASQVEVLQTAVRP